MENLIPADLDSQINIGIFESIGKFNQKYGKKSRFEKQKILFNVLNENIPNNGYKPLPLSSIAQDIKKEIVETYGKENDWENEFLLSWNTDIPKMEVLSSELLEKNGEPVWYVIYSLQGFDCIYIITCQYTENFNPKTQVITYYL